MSTWTDLDSGGRNVGSPHTIRTWTGIKVNPLDAHPSEITIEDIAHALARQCRYNGHVEGFLSVARHSIWVAERLHELGYGRRMEMWGLLHDAGETYLGDMVRPLKHSPEMGVFVQAEERLDEVIAATFDLRFPMPGEVKTADSWVLMNIELAQDGARESYYGDPEVDEADFLEAYARIQRFTRPKPKTTQIIGLTGYARSGKDTAARSLIEKHDFVRLSFAERLYGMLLATDPYVRLHTNGVFERLSKTVERLGWERAKDVVPEVRRLLQRLGTEGVREHLGSSTWIDAALSDVQPGGKYVFTDVRFENEAQAIRDLGGEIWRVERPGFEPVNSHASDAGIPDELVTRVVKNDGDRAALRRSVLSVFTPA